MTIEEAKEQLQEIILDTESLIVGDAAKGIYRKDLEALKMAVSALEKQILRKPIRLLYHEVGDCPFCETTVYISEDGFCPSCGQALDWSETND